MGQCLLCRAAVGQTGQSVLIGSRGELGFLHLPEGERLLQGCVLQMQVIEVAQAGGVAQRPVQTEQGKQAGRQTPQLGQRGIVEPQVQEQVQGQRHEQHHHNPEQKRQMPPQAQNARERCGIAAARQPAQSKTGQHEADDRRGHAQEVKRGKTGQRNAQNQ